MATIYIDPTSPTNGAGTFADPKNTFVGISMVMGNTYAIKAGTTLNEKITISGTNPVNWASRKLLCSYDPATGALITTNTGATATIKGSTDVCLSTYFKSYVEVCGISIDMANVTNAGVFASPDGLRLHQCIISRSGARGSRSAVNMADAGILNTGFEVYNNKMYNAYRGFAMLCTSATLTIVNTRVSGNEIYNMADASIRISTEAGADTDTVFIGLDIYDNYVHHCGGPLQFRTGKGDTTTAVTNFSHGVRIYNNHVAYCGTPAGPNGLHGGISVNGVLSGGDGILPSFVRGNRVHHTYVTGAGIQTGKNNGLIIEQNIVHDIYAGTPTSSFNGGLPIDANGIFIDNLSANVSAKRNLVYNLKGTGHPNSGVAFSFWDCTGSSFNANIAYDVRIGLSFGAASESGNNHRSNTIIRAEYGIYQVGAELIISHTLVGNLFLDCGVDGDVAADNSHLMTHNCSYNTPISAGNISTALTSDPALRSDFTPTNPAHAAAGNAPLVRKDFYGRTRGALAQTGTYPGAVHLAIDSHSHGFSIPNTPPEIPTLGT